VENILKFCVLETHYSPNSYLMRCKEGESFLLSHGQLLLEMRTHKTCSAVSCPKLLYRLFWNTKFKNWDL